MDNKVQSIMALVYEYTRILMNNSNHADEEILRAKAALEAAIREAIAAPGVAQGKIRWTLNGEQQCRYDHWLGETPFGRILITWKGWKADKWASIDEFPGEMPSKSGEPECLKDFSEQEFNRRLALAAAPSPTAEQPERPPYCGSGHCSCIECPYAARVTIKGGNE